jgi:hypothetical protein
MSIVPHQLCRLHSRTSFEVVVGAYSRPMNLAARGFLHGPLAAMRTEIRDGLKEAFEEALG